MMNDGYYDDYADVGKYHSRNANADADVCNHLNSLIFEVTNENKINLVDDQTKLTSRIDFMIVICSATTVVR